MRYLKTLLSIRKTSKTGSDSLSVGLDRLARVQPTQPGVVSVFKAQPKRQEA